MKNMLKKGEKAFWAVSATLLSATTAMGGVYAESTTNTDPEIKSECASILSAFCGDDGIMRLIRFVVSLMMGGVVVIGSIGIVICAVMWMTARDNEMQVRKARSRLIEIVIGMVLFVMLGVVVNILLGGGNVLDDVSGGTN